jgi:hypothetical protein
MLVDMQASGNTARNERTLAIAVSRPKSRFSLGVLGPSPGAPVWAAPRPNGHASRRATRIAPPPRSEPLSRIVLLHLQSPERLEISVMQIYLIRRNPNRRQHTQWSIYICKEERSMQNGRVNPPEQNAEGCRCLEGRPEN